MMRRRPYGLPRHCVRLFLVTSVVAGSLGVVGMAGARAQTASTPSTTTPAGPPERTLSERQIIDAAIRLYKIKADLVDVDTRLADTTTKLADAEKALADTEVRLTQARTDLTDVRQRLQERAAVVYQRHSDRLGMALSVDRVVNLSAGNHYADSVATVDNAEVDRLAALVATLETERAQRDANRRDLTDTKAKLERQHADLQASVDREQGALDKLGGIPVMGTAVLSAAELAAWFKSTGQRARLAGTTTIDDLTDFYLAEGAAEGVRGDLAFAQAVLETGSFGHALDNNYAGIGACDSCTSEMLFPTPRDGVRAQIQLLRNYADPTSRAARLANPPDATIYGTDPAKAAFLYDTFFAKGMAPVWNVMGGGNWATDPVYAGKVLTIYQKMLEFKGAQPRPAA